MVTAAVRFKESPVDIAKWNFESACSRIAIEPDIKALLATPYRELALELPVRLDNGTLRFFSATRVLHNNARGPALGAIRFLPVADSEVSLAFAENTSWTAAVVSGPFGGSCSTIKCDPNALSSRELKALVRCFASRAHAALGPYQDVVLAPDEELAAVLLDEYSSFHGLTPAAVIGKGATIGGAAHTRKAQPRAAALVLREAAEHLGRDLESLRVSIVAEPATASDFLAEFAAIGCTVTDLSDSRGTAHDSNGLNALAVSETIRQHGSVTENPTHADSALFADCDVLVLAAHECALHATNASRVNATIVLEAAPLSVTPSADVVLRQRRANVIPDLLGASGEIVAAHSEWSANLEKRMLQHRDIECELTNSIPKAVTAVFERATHDHSPLRAAAYCIGVERVARTERLRGI